MNYTARTAAARDALAGIRVDALLVSDLTNVRYLTGFSGSNGQVLVTEEGATFFSDPRYAARAADLVKDAAIVIYRSRLRDELPARLGDAGVRRLGFEATTMTVATRDDLAAALPDVELVATRGLVERLRRSKEPAEIELIRSAAALADSALEHILAELGTGQSERAIALDLEYHMRSHGADDVAFEPIVASGPLSAHIHHSPGDRALQRGDLVIFDLGAEVGGYRSDLTRTVVVGAATPRQLATYDRVLEAQHAGLEALQTGAACRDVDRAARAVIDAAGEGTAFEHGLGHGVGLDIHEAPRLHWDSEDALVDGDVVTVEPGVYHVGWGGMRIEDTVVITEQGAEVVTRAARKELVEL